MKLIPPGCRILVEVDTPEIKQKATASGFILPENHQERYEMSTDTGTVIKIGATVNKDFVGDLEIGDKVVFSRYEGAAKKIDGKLYRAINDDAIWMIIKE